MWILTCDGDILSNKRIWLRPGKKYLFGRTLEPSTKNASFQLRDEKSVSRKHLTLSVSNVKRGDGSHVHVRSEIKFKDENTKFRTEIDGERIKDETRVLKGDEHSFRLGNAKHLFRIKWEPVVFTFSLSSKEMKAGKDPLVTYRTRLEDLDIKVILPYLIESTTYVVSTKRNTAKGLQALINGKRIVTDTFIDALIYATTPENLDELESLSPLEEDYDANWPDPSQHLPAKSKEPNERPAEDFSPKPERANVFEGYTFVFCDSVQFETLQAPITNGGGKALEFPLKPGETSTEDIVRYVKGVAGEKGLGEFEDGSEGKGVVVVRFRGKKGFEEWAANLDTEVALALDHRLIEQSEFLDAILMNDASILRRALLPEDDDTPRSNQDASTQNAPQNVPATTQESVEADNPPLPEISQASRRRVRTRGAAVSRFKGFDDDDAFAATVATTPASIPSQPTTLHSGERSQRFLNSGSRIDSAIDMNDSVQTNGESPLRSSRKRAAPSDDEENEEDMIDKLLPAAAALKRRRIEEAEEVKRNGASTKRSFGTSATKVEPEKPNPRKPKKEINIKDAVRERREEEEEAARRDEETLHDTLDGMNIEEMKNLAVVEEMEVAPRTERPQRRTQQHGDTNSRWDERWNGRRNFKKFRRQGEGAVARRGQSVIVPLEEVKKKDFGIGEDYWIGTEQQTKKRKRKARGDPASQSQSQSQLFATAKSEPHPHPDPDADAEEPIDLDALPSKVTILTQRIDGEGTSSQINNTLAKGKRTATNSLMKAQPAKKRKKFAVQDSESDSEDELKFRFNR